MLLQLLVRDVVAKQGSLYVSHTMSDLWLGYTASDIQFHCFNIVVTVIKLDRPDHHICFCFTDGLVQWTSLGRLSHTNNIHKSLYYHAVV